MKYLYFGAWDDFEITKIFPDIKEFVFVDTQPRNEFDDWSSIDDIRFERPYFLKQLELSSQKNNFKLVSRIELKKYSDREIRNPTLLTFKSKTQTINYYISTNFRRDNIKELNKEMQECSGLILSGYFPHKDVVNFLQNTTDLFCINGSCYLFNNDEDEGENVVNYLYENNFFRKIIAVFRNNKKIVECNSITKVCNLLN